MILLQPHSGETFFNITNAQWFLTLALIILLIDKGYRVNHKNFLVLTLLGLTGPFSLLLLPILFLNSIVKRDLKENYLKYLIILATALIQIYFIIQSDRVGGEVDTNIIHWLKSCHIFVTFGTKSFFTILSIFVWIIVSIYLIKFLCDVYKKQFSDNQINGFLIVIGMFIIYFGGLWSFKQFPLALHPLGGGARYFVLPYALFLISLPLLIKHTRVLYVVLFLIFIIDIKQFTKIYRPSLNYQSFVWFARYNKNLNIPINPQLETYPGWHIQINNDKTLKTIKSFVISNENLSLVNAEKSDDKFRSITNDMQLSFGIPEGFKNSSHIGVEININRQQEGWSQIFYTNSENGFSEKKA